MNRYGFAQVTLETTPFRSWLGMIRVLEPGPVDAARNQICGESSGGGECVSRVTAAVTVQTAGAGRNRRQSAREGGRVRATRQRKMPEKNEALRRESQGDTVKGTP